MNMFLMLLMSIGFRISDPQLFIQTDKSVYTPGETIMCTPWILGLDMNDYQKYEFVTLTLLDPVDSCVAASETFYVDRGMVNAGLTIPDLPPADYVLVGYSNLYLTGGQEILHPKLISVRSSSARPLPRNYAETPPSFPKDSVDNFTIDSSEWKINSNLNLALKADKPIYSLGDSIRLKLSLSNLNGDTMMGIFSMSCALSRRVVPGDQDMRKFKYVSRFMNVPTNWTYKDCVDSLKEVVTHPEKQIVYNSRPLIKGLVLKDGKPVKKAVPLALTYQGEGVKIITTDETGNFTISYDMLVTARANSIMLMAAGDNERFTIVYNSLIDSVNNALARKVYHFDYKPIVERIPKLEETVTLKEFVVKANSSQDDYSYFIDKDCNSWVCERGMWLCDCSSNPRPRGYMKRGMGMKVTPCSGSSPMCQRNRPSKGQLYWDPLEQKQVLYMGCPDKDITDHRKELTKVSLSKDFSPESNVMIQRKTTLYWSQLTLMKGDAEICFPTGDVPGIYTCIVNGVSSTDEVFSISTTIEIR